MMPQQKPITALATIGESPAPETSQSTLASAPTAPPTYGHAARNKAVGNEEQKERGRKLSDVESG
jgi:hypothetical protein